MYVTMSRHLTAYIDRPFWETLLRNKPNDATTPWTNIWKGVYDFIREQAHVVACFPESDIKKNPVFAKTLLDYNVRIDFRPELADKYVDDRDPFTIASSNPRSVFFFEDPEIPVQKLREQTGLLFLRHDELRAEWSRLFNVHEITVNPDSSSPFTWGDLTSHVEPLNAVVVADKYAWKDLLSDNFTRNTGQLLKTLLPQSPIGVPVHITMVTDLAKLLQEHGKKPSFVYNRVETYLKEQLPEIPFNLTVLGYDAAGHKDRFVITNYGELSSNDSFAFFKGHTLRKDTKVMYLPSSTHGETTARQLERISELTQEPATVFNPHDSEKPSVLLACGDNLNRLL